MQIESKMARLRSRSNLSSRSLPSIRRVRVLNGYLLEMEISNGRVVSRDFTKFVMRAIGVLARLRTPQFFARVSVSDGALTWPGQIDLCPLHVIYGKSWMTSKKIRRHAEF